MKNRNVAEGMLFYSDLFTELKNLGVDRETRRKIMRNPELLDEYVARQSGNQE